tara:strand:+ start:3133 stop:3711 length:579 start_codon:yes stop_codon:yes gene_type:complete
MLNMPYKKAAMFGLDARIALAIFGALSVISGAALYSAIQQSKVIAIVADMKEAEKALEQFMLDTGVDPNLGTSFGGHSSELVSSSVSGWNGPYLPLKVLGERLEHPVYGDLYLRHVIDADWSHPGAPVTLYCNNAANVGKTCYHWIMINGLTEDISKAVDIYIDGENSSSKGNIRYTGTELYMKSIPTLTKF